MGRVRVTRQTAAGVVVQGYSICGTDVVVFDAWEVSKVMGPHSTITHFEGRQETFGRIGTRRDVPAEVEALPSGPKRWAAVDAWYADQHRRAVAAIREAFPELGADGREDSAEVVFDRWSAAEITLQAAL